MERLYANAKLNLMLRIVDKLPNGYHLLEMINVPITLYDELIIEPSEGFEQIFDPPIDCQPNKTTIYKAYELIKNWVGDIKLKIRVKKFIPTGAGMGGGSSDAGFFIKYVLDKYNIHLDENMVNEIANKVGADVPFFLYNKPAIVKGIGEKVYPFTKFPELNFLLIVPDFTISTAWAYSKVKLPLTKNERNSILNISIIDENKLLEIMRNDLEDVVKKEFPAIIEIKDFMTSLGAKKVMMTGSGSSVFGIFEEGLIRSAELKTKEKFTNYRIFTCKTFGA
ncbi:MAG: 4-(cytidine 5'-diphospho)-2-C-methyl-D-erythritol kinase [Proteobacteria bacterium]|nr:4-(cytidine 5'-diphospho)-2-C-methyl-D-erythritol kinase [Pseudomonadota bacterium]